MTRAARWAGRSVLVTGATGLVGSWLVEALVASGAQVTALVGDADPQSRLLRTGTLGRVSVVTGRLEDYRAVERALHQHEVEVVFHLGAQTIVGMARRSPLATFESNVRGTWHLLEACRQVGEGVRAFVFASSDKAYGTSTELPYAEDHPLAGLFPYDASKAMAEQVARSYQATYGLPLVVARCGNIYGGGDLNWSRLVPGTIRALLRGDRPVVRSDGTFRRDYVYVADVVDAYLLLAERAEEVRGEAFNFGPEAPRTVLEVIELLGRLVGRPDLTPDIRDEAQGEIRDQFLCSAKAARVLGWRPSHTLEAGLELTVRWYRELLGA